MKKISVILAVYNETKYLARCLTTLASQEKVTFEVIVVDDGSPSRVSLQNLTPNLPPLFKLFRIEHSGTAIARNFGATKARGEILVFLDGDMEFSPDFLYQLTRPIENGEAKGTFSTQEYVANWDNHWSRSWNYEQGLCGKLRIDPDKINMIKDFRAILKKEFDRVKGFDDIGYTDTWSLSEKLGICPVPTRASYYHYNPDSLTDVYYQAIWIGGRQRKMGRLGKVIALVRATLPFSLLFGVYKAILFNAFFFVPFKIVYDFGIIMGIMKHTLKK